MASVRMSRGCFARTLLPVIALAAFAPSDVTAQSTIAGCYVPGVGAIYLIKREGLPGACLATSHVEIAMPAAASGATTALGNLALASLTSGIENTALGGEALRANTTGAGNTGVGNRALKENTTGFGGTAVGVNALHSNTTASNNTAVGANALALTTTGGNNTAIGRAALNVNTAPDNTAVGAFALERNTTGGANVAVGRDALTENTTGSNNSAFGLNALANNLTGSSNSALGGASLLFNTTGSNNVGVGNASLRENISGTQNVAVGVFSLRLATAGFHNTAVGEASLFSSTTGSRNTALGQAALNILVAGDDNTALGRDAGSLLVNGSNNIYLGSRGAAVENSTMRLGVTTTSRAFISGVRGVTTSVADAVPVMISSDHQLGTISSSARFKEDISDMGDASSALMKLRPVTFRYIDAASNGEKPLQYGLIAEEVAKVFPGLVAFDSTGAPSTVYYHTLPALMLNEIQRQEGEIAELKAAISAQERALKEIREELARIRGK